MIYLVLVTITLLGGNARILDGFPQQCSTADTRSHLKQRMPDLREIVTTIVCKGMTRDEVLRLLGNYDLESSFLTGSYAHSDWYYTRYGVAVSFEPGNDAVYRVTTVRAFGR
jgi:hypothetical protein